MTNIPYPLALYTMKIITTKKAAKILGVSQSRIRQLIRDGKIHANKVDGSIWVIDNDSFQEFIQKPRPAGRQRRK